jgi:hypothetical protein
MDQKRSYFSLERILLTIIIGIGCLGLTYAFQNKQNFSEQSNTGALIRMQGSFTVDAPIFFTLSSQHFSVPDIEIDFGNGVQKRLKDQNFTYAYRQPGQYLLKIKQNNRVLYQTSIYITRGRYCMAPKRLINLSLFF